MDAQIESPEGYHYEWVAEDESNWLIGGRAYKCRMRGCNKRAAARLRRAHAGGYRWWAYCEDHMYGRRIRNGVIEFKRLVPNESEA